MTISKSIDTGYLIAADNNINNNDNNEYLTDPNTDGFSLLKLQYLKYILFKIFTEKGMSLERNFNYIVELY